MKKETIKRFFSTPTAGVLCGARQHAMMLLTTLLFAMTAQTAWAADNVWPSYITDVVLVGGTEEEAQDAKSDYSGYTWCSQKMNEGKDADIIYIGYKTGTSANTDGGYITDFIIIDAGTGDAGHNPPSDLTFQGRKYYLCPAAGGNYFVNSNHGNLTSQAANGWNMYLYYTRASFDDKRAVSSITITEGKDTQSGALNLYYKDGTLHEKEISLNRGVSGTPYVYMHISTATKVNRPNPEPTTNSGLTYNGSPQKLISSNYTNHNSGTVYYRVGNTGSYTTDVNSITATNAGQYIVWYYSGADSYGNSSVEYRHYKYVKIKKSPNNGATVTCSNHFEETATVPELKGTNLSSGAITYQYSTSQKGTYTTTVPTAPGTYWVKATIAGDDNCEEFTTAATSFNIIYDWRTHNSGAEDDAYVLSTVADLKYLAVWVNSGSNNYAGKYFKLGDDIAFDKSTADNFNPIGNQSYPFAGHLDGNGKTISGLNINKPNNDAVGLFGYVKNGTTIKNLKLDNSTIIGNDNVGAILGRGNDGKQTTVENCFVTSSVNVSGTSNVGGIVGGFANVRGCVSVATVSGVNSVGGIIGTGNLITIANCLYTGTSVSDGVNIGGSAGAITGYKGSGTYDCNYYTQTIIDVNDEDATIGGTDEGDTNGARKAVAINKASGVTFTPTGTATTYNVSGITAYADNNVIGYGGNFYAGATESVNLDITYTSTYEGFSFTGYTDGVGSPATALTPVSGNTYTLTVPATTATITPQDFWGVALAGRNGSADHPYLITEPAGLDLLAKKVNGTDGYTANTFAGTYFELGADITYDYASLGEGESNYTAIGKYNGSNDVKPFSGIFDGKGHTISGIRITKDGDNYYDGSYQGVFGCIRNATVKNVKLADTHITAGDDIGGIAGFNSAATIENCHVTNTVTIQSNGQDGSYYGGIAGELNDYNSVDPCVRGCTSAASVSGYDYVGGIVGYLYDGSITDCLYLGTSVTGTYDIGAIVGHNSYNTLSNNYHTLSGVGGCDGSDVAGACFAYEYPAATDAMGTAGTTYGTGDYTGITAYTDGLVYNGKYYSPLPWTGDGSAEHPFVISTTDGLDKLAIKVNGGTSYSGKYFELGNDIDYSDVPLTLDGGKSNYTPIGDNSHYFSGTFDGKGHKVSGIRISVTSGYYKAIFGGVEGTVKNLVVSDCCMEAYYRIGGIVAQFRSGTIENCHVLSDVTLSGNLYIGGIAARNEGGTVKGCTSAATIRGTKDSGRNADYLGGIVGYALNNGVSPTLTYNLFTGTISGELCNYIGAIVGWNTATLSNNYHTVYGLGGLGGAYGSDTNGNGAQFAVSSTTKPDGFGDATATYGTGSYTGITAYANGLYYNGRYYWHEELTTIEIADHSTENDNIISNNDGQTRNVKLKDRTLYKDGKWNTICLPFDVDMTDPASPLYGATYRTVTAASITGTTLNLTFAEKRDSWAGNKLKAGYPYIIKWDKAADYADDDAHNIVNPIFTNVTVYYVGGSFCDDNDNPTVAFLGTYSARTGDLDLSAFYADGSNNGYGKPFDVLLLGDDNTLRYAGSGASLGACRAYFLIDPAAVTGSNAHQLTDFNIDFGDGEGETTGIVSIDHSPLTIDHSAGAWYSIDGRKLQGKPTKAGVYISNGRKVVIK